MVIRFISGPLEGSEKSITARPPDFVWVEVKSLRLFRARGAKGDRLLYRVDHKWPQHGRDLCFAYAERTHAHCDGCSMWHLKGAKCSMCGGPLESVSG